MMTSSSAFALVPEKEIRDYIKGKLESFVPTSVDPVILDETKGHKLKVIPNTFKLERNALESIGVSVATLTQVDTWEASIQVIDDTTLKIYKVAAEVLSSGDASMTGDGKFKDKNEVVDSKDGSISRLFVDTSTDQQNIVVVIYKNDETKMFLAFDEVVNKE